MCLNVENMNMLFLCYFRTWYTKYELSSVGYTFSGPIKTFHISGGTYWTKIHIIKQLIRGMQSTNVSVDIILQDTSKKHVFVDCEISMWISFYKTQVKKYLWIMVHTM